MTNQPDTPMSVLTELIEQTGGILGYGRFRKEAITKLDTYYLKQALETLDITDEKPNCPIYKCEGRFTCPITAWRVKLEIREALVSKFKENE